MYSSMSRHRHQTATEEVMASNWMVRDNTPQQQPKEQPQQPQGSWLACTWKSLMQQLLNENELQVWQKRNAAGEMFYHVYDPYTGRSNDFASEADLRIWLEQLPNL